jgi:membrane protein
VLDRFAAGDGGLLAAGVAYNAVLALIPIGLLVAGIAGIVLNDPRSRADVIAAVVAFVPPLGGVLDEIVAGLTTASPSISLVGLGLAAWGTSRMYAALETAIAGMDAGAPRRGLIRRTARRIGSVAILAVFVLAAIVATPSLVIAVEISGEAGSLRPLFDVLLLIVPPCLAAVALAAIYRLMPLTRPPGRAIALPALAGAVALVLLTRLFVFVTPRIFGVNLVYGTLGAILIALTWLDLVFTVVLVGAAWVRERTTTAEAPVA